MPGRDHYRSPPRRTALVDAKITGVGAGSHRDSLTRLRVSSPFTVFDSILNHNMQRHLWSGRVDGTGTIIHHPEDGGVHLNVDTDTDAFANYQTKQYFHYQPGKGFLVIMSGAFTPSKLNLRQRAGYFDDNAGLYFELEDNVISAVCRTSTTGVPVNIEFAQADWNLDTLDGTGPSRLSIGDFNVQSLVIDFHWMGTGGVRFGLFLNDNPVYVHEVIFSNSPGEVYIDNLDLPCCVEIRNTGPTTSASKITLVGTTIISEGGYSAKGLIRGVDTGPTAITVSSSELMPLLSLRLNADNLKSFIVPLNFTTIATSNDDVLVRLILNGGLEGVNWGIQSGEVVSETDTAATSISGGVVIWSDYTNQTIKGQALFEESAFVLASTASGVADILTIAAQARQGNANVSASMNYKEVF